MHVPMPRRYFSFRFDIYDGCFSLERYSAPTAMSCTYFRDYQLFYAASRDDALRRLRDFGDFAGATSAIYQKLACCVRGCDYGFLCSSFQGLRFYQLPVAKYATRIRCAAPQISYISDVFQMSAIFYYYYYAYRASTPG